MPPDRKSIPGEKPENGTDPLILEAIRRNLAKRPPGNKYTVPLVDQAETRADVQSLLGPSTPRFAPEKINRLLSLQPRMLELDPEDPEHSPDLLEIERLYTGNVVPDDALLALEAGEINRFESAIARGGMLNRFHPLDDERECYPHGHESVRDQIINDLLPHPDNPAISRSGRPGKYFVQGLYDGDILRAYLSFRVPPHPSDFGRRDEYCRELQRYSDYISSILFDENMIREGKMVYEKKWEPKRTHRILPFLWELDTYNVQRGGWGGAAAILTRAVLQFVKNRYGQLPDGMYCYRFKELECIDSATGQTLHAENEASRDFLKGALGFRNMATRKTEKDRVWRSINGECHMYAPEWQFMYSCPKWIDDNLPRYMRKFGLLGDDEPLLS